MIYFAVVVVFVYIVWNLHLRWRDKETQRLNAEFLSGHCPLVVRQRTEEML